ncbi:MAG TPA: ABC transporter ATP-binding protein [Pyrinomonadaceae bacterium]|nr:ABC transporter ATP-binding protein [Pyrinomonadaceae bacterium]
MTHKPLSTKEVSVSFGAIEVFHDLSLEISQGEFVAVVGPSGCGKTTLLNVLSGFLQPSSGSVNYSGRVRMVYQHDSLLPWKTAAQNIALGLRDLHSETERDRQLKEMLRLIKLEEFAAHYPHQLSGGMRQRVELARALAGDTDILLLDEPFSSLDYLTRLRLRRELVRMLEELPRTVVLVTHDIEEAAQLADRILVLSDRPARICRELRVEIPRPRDLTHPRVVETVHAILAEFGLEQDKVSAESSKARC